MHKSKTATKTGSLTLDTQLASLQWAWLLQQSFAFPGRVTRNLWEKQDKKIMYAIMSSTLFFQNYVVLIVVDGLLGFHLVHSANMLYTYIQGHDLSHITAQQSHHVRRAPRKTQVTSRRWSHITDIIFWKNSLRAPMNPANRIIIFISIRIKKSLRARSPYAIFERNVCIIHSRLHWGAGFDRLVVYASIIAIYIGALILPGWRLRINHGHLHWGAGLDRLVVYASIMAIYIGALVLTGW